MKKLYTLAAIGVFTLLLASFVRTSPTGAKITKGETRPMLTRHLMAGLVKPQSGALRDALKAGPSSDKEWDAVAMQAALLNEASYILMDDKRCPDQVWKDACESLRSSTAAVLAAAEKKDVAAATAAARGMGKACGTCHKAHK